MELHELQIRLIDDQNKASERESLQLPYRHHSVNVALMLVFLGLAFEALSKRQGHRDNRAIVPCTSRALVRSQTHTAAQSIDEGIAILYFTLAIYSLYSLLECQITAIGSELKQFFRTPVV